MRSFAVGTVGVICAALALFAGTPAWAGDADAIVGVWVTEGGRAHVEIAKEGGVYNGKIIWLLEPKYPDDDEKGMAGQEKVDRENPDPSRRNRPLIGLNMVTGFKYAGDGKWRKGRIYDPENGKTYKCKITLTDRGTLKVRGFIGVSLLGRTTEWKRWIPPASERPKF